MKSRSLYKTLFSLATALFLLVFFAPSASAAGTVESSLLQAEKALCKKGAAGKKCRAGAPARAKRKLQKFMAGDGLYGFGLPANLLPPQKGKLLWSKSMPATQGAGRTLFMLYSSRSYPGNKRVAVSGTLSLPPGKAPRGGWPLISWAHGTVGLADSCAPSLGDDGSYGAATPFLSQWLSRGYAVAATDYEGLGTPGDHPYLVGPSAGRSVLDIALATKKLAPVNLEKTTIMGHSQGGHAALWAASLLPQYGGLTAPKTVSYAPPALLASQADLISTQPADAYGLSALALSILRGAVTANPAINPAEVLSNQAFLLYPRTNEVCLSELGEEAAAAGLSPGNLLRPGWKSTGSGQKFYQALESSNPALGVGGKLLLAQGMQDTTVLPLFTTALYSELGSLNSGRTTYWRFTSSDSAPADGLPDNGDFLTEAPSTHSSILSDSFERVKTWLLP